MKMHFEDKHLFSLASLLKVGKVTACFFKKKSKYSINSIHYILKFVSIIGIQTNS